MEEEVNYKQPESLTDEVRAVAVPLGKFAEAFCSEQSVVDAMVRDGRNYAITVSNVPREYWEDERKVVEAFSFTGLPIQYLKRIIRDNGSGDTKDSIHFALVDSGEKTILVQAVTQLYDSMFEDDEILITHVYGCLHGSEQEARAHFNQVINELAVKRLQALTTSILEVIAEPIDVSGNFKVEMKNTLAHVAEAISARVR